MVRNYRKRVLILGGYGSLGARIAQLLSNDAEIQLIIAGRDKFRADLLAARLPNLAEGLRLERDSINLAAQLKALHLDLLIHCAGPFQEQDYRVAQACIDARTPYLDIADGRRFVCDFPRLNPAAEAAGVPLVSGASTLPALSSAALAGLAPAFARIDRASIEIAPGHRTERGLAMVRAGFESLGENFPILRNGQWHETFAGNHLRRVQLSHPIGERWVCDFDVPDLELWPRAQRSLSDMRFGTGVQPRTLQLGLAACAHLSRLRLPSTGSWFATLGHKLAARWPGGSPHGGMQVRISGEDKAGQALARQWQILGLNGDGPWIPAAPAAALARKFLRGEGPAPGASICWQLLEMDDILRELTPYSVVTAVEALETPANTLTTAGP
ncbi:saccharopine dehydrogenase NADP-binding domain-containing protein [Microbulbifer guangxiensis]|uniref:saccharopine dehydrogenase NADP-binding domain-containing protein n=1 Tax=Microbulbifer guangxiensis TaxID=2904249 RepID=UPI001F20E92A|nr:saccharopine dehydrogenase NADP-binding domain-containing protein [Microbulbifer guangxiensis]